MTRTEQSQPKRRRWLCALRYLRDTPAQQRRVASPRRFQVASHSEVSCQGDGGMKAARHSAGRSGALMSPQKFPKPPICPPPRGFRIWSLSVFAGLLVRYEEWPVSKVYEPSLQTPSSETLQLALRPEAGEAPSGEGRQGAGACRIPFPKAGGDQRSPRAPAAREAGGRSGRRGPGGGRTALAARALRLRRPRALSLVLARQPPPALLRAQATRRAPRHLHCASAGAPAGPLLVHPHRARVPLSSRPGGGRAAAAAHGPRVPPLGMPGGRFSRGPVGSHSSAPRPCPGDLRFTVPVSFTL